MPDRVLVLLDQRWKVPMGKTVSQWSWMKDVRWPLVCILHLTLKESSCFSRIHWQLWFHRCEPRDCGERKHKCRSRSHGSRRSFECPASPHGIRYFVITATYIPLIAIISLRVLASSLRFLYTTSRTLTRSNLSATTNNFLLRTRPHSLIT